jgi:hypothetical protein
VQKLIFKNSGPIDNFITWIERFKGDISANSLVIEIDPVKEMFISKTYAGDHSLVRYSQISFKDANLQVTSKKLSIEGQPDAELSERVFIGIYAILPKFIEVLKTLATSKSFDLTVNSIITLLMMKPGQYPSIPELGLDIESYLFEYADDKKILQKLHAKLRDQMNRIDISGVDVQFQSDYTEDGTPVLLVIITGNKFVAYGSRSDKVIVGITYSKLNELYIRKVYDERSNQT